jgi:hypothetical protein
MLMSSPTSLKYVYNLCGCRVLRWGRGVETKRLVAMGQLILSMGLVWREVRILAQKGYYPK